MQSQNIRPETTRKGCIADTVTILVVVASMITKPRRSRADRCCSDVSITGCKLSLLSFGTTALWYVGQCCTYRCCLQSCAGCTTCMQTTSYVCCGCSGASIVCCCICGTGCTLAAYCIDDNISYRNGLVFKEKLSSRKKKLLEKIFGPLYFAIPIIAAYLGISRESLES